MGRVELMDKDEDAAATAFAKAVELNPDNVWAWNNLGLVYLYKRGSWYPFAPTGQDRRDNATELQIKSLLATDLRLEQDLARWFPVYGAPGL